VRDMSGQVVAAVSLASASPFMPETRLEEVAPLAHAAAEAISRELGWTE
jgi:DNA-binding IclR family transcriptional regulator